MSRVALLHPNPSQSHFRSMDVWQAGSLAEPDRRKVAWAAPSRVCRRAPLVSTSGPMRAAPWPSKARRSACRRSPRWPGIPVADSRPQWRHGQEGRSLRDHRGGPPSPANSSPSPACSTSCGASRRPTPAPAADRLQGDRPRTTRPRPRPTRRRPSPSTAELAAQLIERRPGRPHLLRGHRRLRPLTAARRRPTPA